MIVHRLQQEFDDNIVDGLGRLLGGVGNRLKQVKEKVGQRVAEVAETVRTDYEENFSLPPPKPPQDDGVEDALKIKNDEIKRMRREFEVTIKAKEMEVEELTSRIVALEVGSDEQGGREPVLFGEKASTTVPSVVRSRFQGRGRRNGGKVSVCDGTGQGG